MPAGRPRKIKSPEEFNLLVDLHVANCIGKDEPLTITGLCLALGFVSREGFYHYGREYPEFSDSVKRSRLIVEHSYEISLKRGVGNAASIIFALKNMGWSDRQEIAHEGITVTITGKDTQL